MPTLPEQRAYKWEKASFHPYLCQCTYTKSYLMVFNMDMVYGICIIIYNYMYVCVWNEMLILTQNYKTWVDSDKNQRKKYFRVVWYLNRMALALALNVFNSKTQIFDILLGNKITKRWHQKSSPFHPKSVFFVVMRKLHI